MELSECQPHHLLMRPKDGLVQSLLPSLKMQPRRRRSLILATLVFMGPPRPPHDATTLQSPTGTT
jgi:hypothetical protein